MSKFFLAFVESDDLTDRSGIVHASYLAEEVPYRIELSGV